MVTRQSATRLEDSRNDNNTQRVIIASDSPDYLNTLAKALAQQEGISIAATAAAITEARDLIVELTPDLLVCALTPQPALVLASAIMRHRPMPIVCLLEPHPNAERCKTALVALGVKDVIISPALPTANQAMIRSLLSAVSRQKQVAPPAPPSTASKMIIAIGASTGGTEALEQAFRSLAKTSPAVIVAQHIPARFSHSFACRLHKVSQLQVREAVHGDILTNGLALIAPGDYHMRVVGRDGAYRVLLDQGEKVWHQRPSVDVLFGSVAASAPGHAVGVLLTGMGQDGALGLKQLRDAHCWTIVQDEASSVVFGMPGAAVAAGAACQVCPLQHIAGAIGIATRRLREKIR